MGQFTLDRAELTLFDRERERSDVARVLFSNIARAINPDQTRDHTASAGGAASTIEPKDHAIALLAAPAAR